jgi:ubiquinone/menaquinone biosynthesis C-methylase UbiE
MTVELTQQLLGIALARGFTSTFDVTRQLGWPPRSHGREPATEPTMSERFHFEAGAAGYDRGFGSVSPKFIPALLRAAKLTAGQRVLDVATGSGLAAQAACGIVGPSGHVVATDISAPILDQARRRLAGLANVSLAIEDGAALSFPEGSFDVVLCSMGLMLFPNPARGLSEFFRVVREGGRAAVSVGTTSQRSFVARVSTAIGRHFPSRAASAARFFSLGDAQRLRALFETAGFRTVETISETRRFPFPSFDAYFEPIEAGWGNIGSEYVSLASEVRHVVREEVRRELEGDEVSGRPIDVEVEILIASGQK